MSLTTAELIVVLVVVVVVVIGMVVICVYCWKALATISIEATKQGQSFGRTFRSSLRQGFRRLSSRGRRRNRTNSHDSNRTVTTSADTNTPEANTGAPVSGTRLRESPPSYDEALNHKLVRERLSQVHNSGSFHGVDVNIVNADMDVLTERPNARTHRAQYLPISDSLLINPAFFLGAETVPRTTEQQGMVRPTSNHAQSLLQNNVNVHSLQSNNVHSLPVNNVHVAPSTTAHSLVLNSAGYVPLNTAHSLPVPSNNAQPLEDSMIPQATSVDPQSPPYRERYIGDEADEGGFLKAQEHHKPKKSPPRALKEPTEELQRSNSQRESQYDAQSSKGSIANSDTLGRRHSQHTYTHFIQTATKLFQHHLSRQNLDSSAEEELDAALSTTSSGYKTQDTHSCNGLSEANPRGNFDGYYNPLYRSEGHLNLSAQANSDSERSYCLTAIPRRHSDKFLDKTSNELDSIIVFPDEDRDHILTETYI